ncbi:MAG: hypothetical protein P1U47_12230 [Zhongshania sp.]|nr:hypothetical protein [Zhongshania sp.]
MMTKTTALSLENPRLLRNMMLTALLALAVALAPKQAHADNADAAVAVLIGAAVLYAAHDSHKSDKRYKQQHAHVHDRHCGHHVEYRGNDRRHDGHVNYQYQRDRYSSSYGKHHKYVEQKHSGKHGNKYAKQYDKHDRYSRDDHKGNKYSRDDRHNNQSWNTRVRVSQGH